MRVFKNKIPYSIIFLIVTIVFMMIESCSDKNMNDKAVSNNISKVEQIDHNVTIYHRGKEVFSYVYDDAQFKPYVKKLYSPEGVNVLLDSPDDHKHHHALMYAIKVDGTNFWEEVDNSGRQEPQSTSQAVSLSNGEKTDISFTSTIHWIRPEKPDVLLTEKRSIKLEITKNINARLLTWTSQLTLPENMASAELSGAHYHGLGMRFIRAMDEDGEFFTAGDKVGTIFRGEERLIPDTWCAYTANTGENKHVTVAMFRDPHNPGENTNWFTMKTPFTYLSATRALHENNYLLKAGETLSLTYGVAIWDSRPGTDEVDKVYRYWTMQNLNKGDRK